MLQPEHDRSDVEHGEVVAGALLISGGDAAELLQAVEEPLYPIARPIGLSIKASTAALVALGGDHRPDAARAQVSARGLARKRLVARHPPRPQAWTAPLAADCTCIKQGWESGAVVALTTSQMEGHGLAMPFSPDVDLGREPAPAPAERLVRGLTPR